MGLIEFTLNGIDIPSPQGWEDAQVNASFKSGVQPNISVSEFSFEEDAISIIDAWVSTFGVYRGCPLIIKDGGFVIFNGYLDFFKRFTKVHCGKYIVAIQKSKGLNELIEGIDGYTMSLLNLKSPLAFHNVPYIIEKKNNGLELALVSVTTLLLLKELYEASRRLGASIISLAKAVASPLSSVGELLGLAMQVIIDVIYTIALVKALKDAITTLLDNTISPVRYHKCINVDSTLLAFFNVLGFNGYQTGVSEFKELYYFPSKEIDLKGVGIPNATDYGYLMSEFIQVLKDATKSKLAVDNANTVQFRSENDNYFIRNSTYVMPDVGLESTDYNIDELNGTKTISFNTDVNDEWTIDNFKGTAYDVYTKTTASSGTNLVKGLSTTKLNVCLANRKDGLNDLERALKNLAGLLDSVVKTLGGNSNLSGKITARIGMIKVSQNNWSQPKLVMLSNNNKLASNHRNLWSAKAMYDKYINYDSFVLNGYAGQKKIFKGIEVPFCKEDFKELIDNSYFRTSSGNIGKFTNLKKGLDSGKAIADFWIRDIYDKNLIEEYVEP